MNGKRWQQRVDEKWGGYTLDLWSTGDTPEEVEANRDRLLTALRGNVSAVSMLTAADCIACCAALGALKMDDAENEATKAELIRKLGVMARSIQKGAW